MSVLAMVIRAAVASLGSPGSPTLDGGLRCVGAVYSTWVLGGFFFSGCPGLICLEGSRAVSLFKFHTCFRGSCTSSDLLLLAHPLDSLASLCLTAIFSCPVAPGFSDAAELVFKGPTQRSYTSIVSLSSLWLSGPLQKPTHFACHKRSRSRKATELFPSLGQERPHGYLGLGLPIVYQCVFGPGSVSRDRLILFMLRHCVSVDWVGSSGLVKVPVREALNPLAGVLLSVALLGHIRPR